MLPTRQRPCFRLGLALPSWRPARRTTPPGRSQGRGPVEMRIGLNAIRVTADAERDWQRRMQAPSADLEQRAQARAVKAGEAAAKSSKHVSKKARRGRPAA